MSFSSFASRSRRLASKDVEELDLEADVPLVPVTSCPTGISAEGMDCALSLVEVPLSVDEDVVSDIVEFSDAGSSGSLFERIVVDECIRLNM